MATFSEIEDLRNWFEDTCGEMGAKLALLNGDEPAAIIETIVKHSETLRETVLLILNELEKLLIIKKQDEYEG